jgi:outer membrane protein assembly factor BamB
MRAVLLLGACFLCGAASLSGADWPGWRGGGDGVSGEANLPLRWDRRRNVRWVVEVPGEGKSSPIVWGRRVYLTAARDGGERRFLLAYDRDTGRLLWTGEIADRQPERSGPTGHAAATPVTDGKRIWAAFGNAGVVCFDAEGKLLWRRELGAFDTELGLATSPLLAGDRLFLVCDHDGDRFTSFDSFLVCLDAATGKEVWRTPRRDLGRSWSTPLLAEVGAGKRELIVCGQEEVRAYDPETGRLLWRQPGLSNWVAPSPVAGRGLVFATCGKDGATLALRPGTLAEGVERLVWKVPRGGPYVASPLLHGDHVYLAQDNGFLTCLEAATGKLVYRERLGGKFTASPLAAPGRIYLTDEAGRTYVVKSGGAFELLARNDLEEDFFSSPAASGGLLFLRTEKHLWCLGAE